MRSDLLEENAHRSPVYMLLDQQKAFVALPPPVYSVSFLSNLKWKV